MATINRLTRGLLSLLDSQAQGQNPRSLGEEIVPVLDMETFLFASTGVEISENSQVVSAIGPGVSFAVVPAGQMWLARSIHLQSIAGDAGAIGTFNTYWQPGQGTNPIPLYPYQNRSTGTAAIAGPAYSNALFFPHPIAMNQGSSLVPVIDWIGSVIVVGWTIISTLRFIRLQV